MPFTETVTLIRRSYQYTDYESSVSFDESIDIEANVQHPSQEQAQSLLEGERIDRKPIDIRIPRSVERPKISDQDTDEVADLIEWQGEYYELKARRLHTMVIPHWYCIGVRVDQNRIEGLPP